MKVWIKLTAGAVIGLLLGIFLPPSTDGSSSFMVELSRWIITAGRYILFPFLFFSLAVAINSLRRDKVFASVFWRSLAYMAGMTIILVVVAALFILIFSPHGLEIFSTRRADVMSHNWLETLQLVIPTNAFQVLTGNGEFLLPVYVLSFILGLHLDFDKDSTAPTVQLFDSLSRILYHLNSFFIELFGMGMIVVSAAWLIQLRMIQDLGTYVEVIVILSIGSHIVIFGVLPLILYFFGGVRSPFKLLFGLLGGGLGAFFSGDNFFTLGLVTRFTRENLGVPRKSGAFTLPLFTMFSRGGTALVTVLSFFIILKSYAKLDVTIDQFFWTILFSFLLSFTLPSVPVAGPYVSLVILGEMYGFGLDKGYLLMQPIIPVLASFAALLDGVVSGVLSYLVSHHTGLTKSIKSKLFI